jgi:hypothetical protein
MKLSKNLTRVATLPLALLLVGAGPPAKVVPDLYDSKLALVIPTGSPVKFRSWKDGYAQFDGQFVLTGNYALSVMDNCDGIGEACIQLDIEPDPPIAARLPYWNNRGKRWGNADWITITEEKRLVKIIANSHQRAALVAGKIRSLTGRTAIVVDDFSTGGGCESVWFAARFVAIAKAPKIARTNFTGAFGCAA